MASPVSVHSFEAKSHDTPDESRRPEKTQVDLVRLDEGFTLGRLTLEPGWSWSECVKPVVGTDSCQVSHVGYMASGRLTVRLEDGRQKTIQAGDSYTIPPGHDAWVEDDQPVVAIELVSAEQYAKPSS